MVNSFALLDFGAPELVIILAIVLLLFGGKKLPELSKSVGQSMRELRKGMGDIEGLKNDFKLSDKPKATTSVKPETSETN